MKKLLAILLVLVMCFAMVACSSKKPDKDNDKDDAGSGTSAGSSVGAVDAVVGVYDALAGFVSGTQGLSAGGELSVYLSDEALTVLEQAVFGGETGMDLKWINNLTVGVDVAKKNDLMSLAMNLGLSKTKIISLDILMDMANSKLFMGIPELSSKYLGKDVDLPTPAWTGLFTDYSAEVLPSAETFGKLLNKYLDIALDNITLPEKESAELTASGLTKTVSKQTVVINQKMIAAVCTAVLTEAKTDTDIQAILQDIQTVMAAEYPTADVDVHAAFVQAIDELLEDMADESLSEEELATVTLYTDGDLLIGVTVESQGRELCRCVTVNTADKTGIDIALWMYSASAGESGTVYGKGGKAFGVAGSGTQTNGKHNGTYEVTVQDRVMLSVEFKDVTESAGTVRVWPEEGLYDSLGSQNSSALSVMDLGLEFVFNRTANKEEITVNLLSGTAVYAGVTLKVSTGTDANITLPSDSQVVDVQDNAAMQNWVNSLDLNKIVDNLRKGGLPTELVDMLESALNQGFTGSGEKMPISVA